MAREPSLADRAAGGSLFYDDRTQASDWCAYAAEIVEAGAGGAATSDDSDGERAPRRSEADAPVAGKSGSRP